MFVRSCSISAPLITADFDHRLPAVIGKNEMVEQENLRRFSLSMEVSNEALPCRRVDEFALGVMCREYDPIRVAVRRLRKDIGNRSPRLEPARICYCLCADQSASTVDEQGMHFIAPVAQTVGLQHVDHRLGSAKLNAAEPCVIGLLRRGLCVNGEAAHSTEAP